MQPQYSHGLLDVWYQAQVLCELDYVIHLTGLTLSG